MDQQPCIERQRTLSDLSTKFPPVLIKDIDLGNNPLRKYQSDRELFQEYKYCLVP